MSSSCCVFFLDPTLLQFFFLSVGTQLRLRALSSLRLVAIYVRPRTLDALVVVCRLVLVRSLVAFPHFLIDSFVVFSKFHREMCEKQSRNEFPEFSRSWFVLLIEIYEF